MARYDFTMRQKLHKQNQLELWETFRLYGPTTLINSWVILSNWEKAKWIDFQSRVYTSHRGVYKKNVLRMMSAHKSGHANVGYNRIVLFAYPQGNAA